MTQYLKQATAACDDQRDRQQHVINVKNLRLQMTGDVGAGDLYRLWGGAWDPHDPNRLCTAGGNGVQVILQITSASLLEWTAVLSPSASRQSLMPLGSCTNT